MDAALMWWREHNLFVLLYVVTGALVVLMVKTREQHPARVVVLMVYLWPLVLLASMLGWLMRLDNVIYEWLSRKP